MNIMIWVNWKLLPLIKQLVQTILGKDIVLDERDMALCLRVYLLYISVLSYLVDYIYCSWLISTIILWVLFILLHNLDIVIIVVIIILASIIVIILLYLLISFTFMYLFFFFFLFILFVYLLIPWPIQSERSSLSRFFNPGMLQVE